MIHAQLALDLSAPAPVRALVFVRVQYDSDEVDVRDGTTFRWQNVLDQERAVAHVEAVNAGQVASLRGVRAWLP